MVVGNRLKTGTDSLYRSIGKSIINSTAKLLMKIPVDDLNSGIKLYRTDLAKKYCIVCPDAMPYSVVITLVFVSQGHLVIEKDVSINPRLSGESNITFMAGMDTLKQILNIVAFFNPTKIFFPVGIILIIAGVAWGLPIVLDNDGVSVASTLSILIGILIFLIGLIAEQVAAIRRDAFNKK